MDKLNSKVGDEFAFSLNAGVVLMKVSSLRCGDVWNCIPSSDSDSSEFDQDLCGEMVFTDSQIHNMVKRYNASRYAVRNSAWRIK